MKNRKTCNMRPLVQFPFGTGGVVEHLQTGVEFKL